jgi:hypothetical protein
MGGWGSGPRRPGGTRWAAERCHALDTAALRRWGLLAPGTRSGSVHWGDSTVDYTLAVGPGGGTLRLAYRVAGTGEPLTYPVRLVTTPCHFGGVRWWFVCPLSTGGVACGRRVRKLYRAGRYFGCRRCLGLTYASTQESDARVYAAVRNGLAPLGDIRRLSARQLGFALKVLLFEERRQERMAARRPGGTAR